MKLFVYRYDDHIDVVKQYKKRRPLIVCVLTVCKHAGDENGGFDLKAGKPAFYYDMK
ncbi:YfmQ family protein [Bacillus licheniformis]|nr:YfmQ family protein [Bacillus licheniformis]